MKLIPVVFLYIYIEDARIKQTAFTDINSPTTISLPLSLLAIFRVLEEFSDNVYVLGLCSRTRVS